MRIRTTRRTIARRVYAAIDLDTDRAREAKAVAAKGYYTPPHAESVDDERDPVEIARAANAALRGGNLP